MQDYHQIRLDYGPEKRFDFCADYFESVPDTVFKHPLNYDVWWCEECKEWELSQDHFDHLVCMECKSISVYLDPVLDFGMHIGYKLSEVPEDYKRWLLASKRK